MNEVASWTEKVQCPVSLYKNPATNSSSKTFLQGRLGVSVGWAADFGSGHDLAVRESEPRIGLCADSSEPGACFGFCVSQSLSLPLPRLHSVSLLKINTHWGTQVAQSVKCPTLAQVMISQSVSSSPTLGSVLTAQSLEPASNSVSPSLSLCPSPACVLSLSQK